MKCLVAKKQAKKYKIYIHKNKINGKVYVGQTSKTLNDRSRSGEGYKHNCTFYSAIKEYGWENFEHKILEECTSIEEAYSKEKHYIELYKSNKEEFGYNMTNGGNKGTILSESAKERQSKSKTGEKNPMKNHIFSEEHRKNLSNALKGKKKSKEWISKIMKNNNHKTMLGKKHSKETREKMSLSQIGNKKGQRETYILYLKDNTIEKYSSRKEIYQKINMTNDYISRNRNKRSFPTEKGEVIIMTKEEYKAYRNGKCTEMFPCK